MTTDILKELFERDLTKLKNEVEQYSDSADLWVLGGDMPNSAGNLTLHLVGNLKHFIGAVLGNTGYIRDREREFSDTLVPREDLVMAIDETRAVVSETLGRLSQDDLEGEFPVEVQDRRPSTAAFLMHLATHLNYHLGQINYHRRALAKQFKGE